MDFPLQLLCNGSCLCSFEGNLSKRMLSVLTLRLFRNTLTSLRSVNQYKGDFNAPELVFNHICSLLNVTETAVKGYIDFSIITDCSTAR